MTPHGSTAEKTEIRPRSGPGASADTEKLLCDIADNMPALIAYVDADLKFRFNNRTCAEWFGLTPRQLYGRQMDEVFGAGTCAQIESDLRQIVPGTSISFEHETVQDGKPRHLQVIIRPDTDHRRKIRGYYLMANDITEHKQSAEEMLRRAQFDSLTGLPNRDLFNDRLQQAYARNQRDRRQLALMYLDIDRFKQINDTHGHAAGDCLLQAFAERLRQCVRASDTVARLGGDEFTILMEALNCQQDAVSVATKILAAMQAPFTLAGRDCRVSTSIGIAFRQPEIESDALLNLADHALYQAKAGGRDTYYIMRAPTAANLQQTQV